MLRTLSSDLVGTVILGGDFIIALDQLLHKPKFGKSHLLHQPKQSLCIAKILHSHGLVDVWRELNPSSRDYTHFSAPHQTHARIDHIHIMPQVLPLVTKSCICDTPMSDHTIVKMSLTHPGRPKRIL